MDGGADAGGDLAHSFVEVRLDRVDRTYRPGEAMSGTLLLGVRGGWAPSGLTVAIRGSARLFLPFSAGAPLGEVEEVEELVIVETREQALRGVPGWLAPGLREVPFRAALPAAAGPAAFLPTYHGVLVRVAYELLVRVDRGRLSRPLRCAHEFYVDPGVRRPRGAGAEGPPAPIAISRAGCFAFEGRFHALSCRMDQAVTGELTCVESTAPVESIDLRLRRCETVRFAGEPRSSVSDVLSIQVASGDVARGMLLPLYLVLPKRACCPDLTHAAGAFRVRWRLCLSVSFADGTAPAAEEYDLAIRE